MPATFTAAELLKGALFALEQGGLLIGDAVQLCESQRYASAVVLAVYAREEIGRYKILLELRNEALVNGPHDIKEVKARCENHKKKLDPGYAGSSLSLPAGDPDLLGFMDPDGTPSRALADAKIAKLMADRRTVQPDQTHRTRLRAVHVDALPGSDPWNRPSDIPADDAIRFVRDVGNDYSQRYYNLTHGNPRDPVHVQIELEMRAWPGCPKLPVPVWPERA